MAKKKVRRGTTKPKATIQDIVGGSRRNGAREVPRKWRKHYEQLLTQRDKLIARHGELGNLAMEENPASSTHMADAATDAYDRDLVLGMRSSEQDAVYQIDQALDRIVNGTYGMCELTGKPIELERLDAVPWARFSVAAEKSLEQHGARNRPHLGEREPVRSSESEEDEDAPD